LAQSPHREQQQHDREQQQKDQEWRRFLLSDNNDYDREDIIISIDNDVSAMSSPFSSSNPEGASSSYRWRELLLYGCNCDDQRGGWSTTGFALIVPHSSEWASVLSPLEAGLGVWRAPKMPGIYQNISIDFQIRA
jgi:hypothetical protein